MNIKYGDSFDFSNILTQSFGKILYSKIKEKNREHVSLVDLKSNTIITYGELLDLSVKLAVNLKSTLGINKNDNVMIISQNSWKFIVTILSAFYIGAKITLVNHDYSKGELEHNFSICSPNYIFCTTKTLNNILEIKENFGSIKNIILLDGETDNSSIDNIDKFMINNEDIHGFKPENCDPIEEIALILSSSGITGLPKAVLLTHANLITATYACNDSRYISLNEDVITLGYLPFFHTFGASIMFTCLLFGSELIIMEKFAPLAFLEAIDKYKITTLFTVPSILVFLATSPLLENYDLSSIDDILCGAAPVDKDIETAVSRRCKIDSIRQLYGLTECSGLVTCTPKETIKHGSIGKPICGYRMKISDIKTGEALGSYQLGEICVKGAGIMKGYLNNIEETESSFDSDGFLKTGDLGYFDEDDYFFIVDRIKEIIKYKGHQVSPAELEQIIQKHPAVRDTAVAGKPDDRFGEIPIAFVVKKPGAEIREQDIINFVAEQVSFQKRLHGVIFMDAIPRNASGKILRRELKTIFLNMYW